ncbi:MAG: ParB/RepB/Spo0J family partition protein [Proteobacteria bacterium]|nr:ParB/RepB/Spo0J family partition protein [Pseudomonadota bacterium]
MASKILGGANLGDIARQVKERAAPSPVERPGGGRPVMAVAELAITGRTPPPLERENIFSVDPKRVRPWKYHNRTEAWYTRERCQDLIESIAKDEQQEPALARKLVGDPNFDYELIYGMRRRYACEVLNRKLKVRVVEADDTRAAVLMHIENADRQDITPMERALSFLTQIEAKIFATQDALSEAIGLSKGQVAKMLKAAQLMRQATIGALFADKSAVPIAQAYNLSTLLERPGAKEVILQAAKNLGKDGAVHRPPGEILRHLATSLDRSKKFTPVQKQYNVGAARRVTVTRNSKGKVTFAFPQGLEGVDPKEVLAAVEQIVKDLG